MGVSCSKQKFSVILLVCFSALLLYTPSVGAHSGHKIYRGNGGFIPVEKPEAKKKPEKKTGVELWKSEIDKRFSFWGEHFGRTWNSGQRAICFRVVTRESGWNPRAHNGSFHGLFQIWYLHAPRRNLFNPIHNIEVAAQLWGRKGWADWPSTAY